MKRKLVVLGLLTGLTVIGCRALDSGRGSTSSIDDAAAPRLSSSIRDADEAGEPADEAIALDAVSASIKQAAIDAVPGLVLSSAEREVERGVTIYCLKGTARGQQYEVEVTADGQVKEIENESSEGDDDDDGDDDDKDDDD